MRFLPPYSPDFNPIEKACSKLKAMLRKIGERTVIGLRDLIGILATATFAGYVTGISTTAAGMLPAPSNATIRQSTVPRHPCTAVPADFVAEANSKSVPTAVAG